jgi:hypothetical protein
LIPAIEKNEWPLGGFLSSLHEFQGFDINKLLPANLFLLLA